MGEETKRGVDPIDVAVPSVEGEPRLATLIAFATEKAALAGVVSAPTLGLPRWAGLGPGASQSTEGAVTAAGVSIVSHTRGVRAPIPDSVWGWGVSGWTASAPLHGLRVAIQGC
jgi:fructose-1,6-bisphosphatase/inositol monophosphatase family enzyme